MIPFKKLLVFISLYFAFVSYSFATHIAGGELSRQHVSGNTYRFQMFLYFDEVNGSLGALDNSATIRIFRKGDDEFVETLILPLVGNESVAYTQPDCAIGSLSTRLYRYELDYELDPAIYSDPDGYYMIWERCCRNFQIDNIENPGSTGQTFYMEFPGLDMENSSPVLLPPLNDYACVNQAFTFNFAGEDPDGDSLVYRLTTPIAGNSDDFAGTPPPLPRPYDLVQFVPSITEANMVPGTPPLIIDQEGILSLTANTTGLFVFGVAVDEYRNGVKIGQIIREFQLLVISCPSASTPDVTFNTSSGTYIEGDTITYQFDDPDKCETIELRDLDANTEGTVRVRAVNFGLDEATITFSTGSYAVTGAGDVATLDICFPDCPLEDRRTYLVDVIVEDNSCSVPLRDTVRVAVDVIEPNIHPILSSTLTLNPVTGIYEASVQVEQTLNFELSAEDADNDDLQIDLFPNGFDADAVGINFTSTLGTSTLIAPFEWTPSCDLLAPDLDSVIYEMDFVVRDFKNCPPYDTDTITAQILVHLPPNPTLPILSSSLTYHDAANKLHFDTLQVHDFINFSLDLEDGAGDSLTMFLEGVGFTLDEMGVQFADTTGIALLTGTVNWATECNDALLNPTDTISYLFNVYTSDYDYCGYYRNQDTSFVRLTLLPDLNTLPQNSATLLFDAVNNTYFDTIQVNDVENFVLEITDADHDSLSLSIFPQSFDMDSLGMTFTPTSGNGIVSAEFDWLTNCNHLSNPVDTTDYYFDIVVNDYDVCDTIRSVDTVKIRLRLLPEPNNLPVTSASLLFDAVENLYYDSLTINQLASFTMEAFDVDNDTVSLSLYGDGFTLDDIGATFTPTSGVGIVNPTFEWHPLCTDLDNTTDTTAYFFNAVTIDLDTCNNIRTSDTTRIRLVVLPEVNTIPTTSSTLTYTVNDTLYFDSIVVHTPIQFDIALTDVDGDSLTLDLIGNGFDLPDFGMSFAATTGFVMVSGQFNWATECNNTLLSPTDTTNYEFFAVITDYDSCDNVRSLDSIPIRLTLLPDLNSLPVTSSSLTYNLAGDSLFFDTLTVNQLIQFDLEITDANGDSLTLELDGDGFSLADIGATFTATTGFAIVSGQFNWAVTCQDLTNTTDTTTYHFDALVRDYDVCDTVRSLDTVHIRLTLVPEPNTLPLTSANLLFENTTQTYFDTLTVNELAGFQLEVSDADNDSLTVELLGVVHQSITTASSFTLADIGATFSPTSGQGLIQAQFDWQTNCNHLVGLTDTTTYFFKAIVKDYDDCTNVISTDTTDIRLSILPLLNANTPQITSDLDYDATNETYFDSLIVDELADFMLFVNDADADSLTLDIVGDGFSLTSVNMNYSPSIGTGSINSNFTWQTACEYMTTATDTTTFFMDVIASDYDTCGNLRLQDSSKLRLVILPKPNPAPTIITTSSVLVFDAGRNLYTHTINLGETLNFTLDGDDADGDNVTITAAGRSFNLSDLNMQFNGASGAPVQQASFSWTVDCEIYTKASLNTSYLIDFIVADGGNCQSDKRDTLQVELIINDLNNTAPTLNTDLNFDSNTNCYFTELTIGDTLSFDVIADDVDALQNLDLTATPIDFTFAETGMTFPNLTGTATLTGTLDWIAPIDLLAPNEPSREFEIRFRVDDPICESDEICVKIKLNNCVTPSFAGLPPITYMCAEGDTLGRQIPEHPKYTYFWSSDVGIEGDSTQRTIFVQKEGNYTIRVQNIAPHCVVEQTTRVEVRDIYLDPADVEVCEGELPASLYGRDVANPDGYIYEWRNLEDTTILQSDLLGILETSDAGFYEITVTNPNGNCQKRDTVQLTVHPAPSFTIGGYDGGRCDAGDTLYIENTNITNMKIEWLFLKGADTTGAFLGATDGLEATVLRTGTYQITVTDTATNCSTVQTIDIDVNSAPTLALDEKFEDFVLCQYEQITVDAFDYRHPFNAVYTWRDLNNDVIVSDSSKLTLDMNSMTNVDFGIFEYEITIQRRDEDCQRKDTIRVEYQRQSAAQISSTQTGYCLGETIELAATGANHYRWSTGDTTQTLTFTPQEVGTYTFVVEGWYPNACTSSFDTLQVAVSTVPFVDIGTAIGVCEQDSTVFLDALHSSHPYNAQYKWHLVGDTTLLSSDSRLQLNVDNFASLGYDPLMPFDVVVTVSNSSGGCPQSDTAQVRFGKAAFAEILEFPTEICLGESIRLRATGGDSLAWNTGDSTAVVEITPTQTGYERFIVFASNPNECPVTSDTVFVKVNELPSIDLHPLDSIQICEGDTLTLIPTGGMAGGYLWEHDGSTSDTLVVVPNENTTYYVTGTDQNGCQNTDSLRVLLKPTAEFPLFVQLCEGDTAEIGGESPVPATYSWQRGILTTPTIKVVSSGKYTVTITTDECVYSRTVEVVFKEFPKLLTTSDTTLCFEFDEEQDFATGKTHIIRSQILNPDSTANYFFTWRDSTGTILSGADSLEIAAEGTYILTVLDVNLPTRCETVDTVRIQELCEPRIYVPTSFTPNNDGLNDYFEVFGRHIENVVMQVYDRWGTLIFHLEKPTLDEIETHEWWNGTIKGEPVGEGIYTWSIEYSKPLSGENAKEKIQGTVIIIR